MLYIKEQIVESQIYSSFKDRVVHRIDLGSRYHPMHCSRLFSEAMVLRRKNWKFIPRELLLSPYQRTLSILTWTQRRKSPITRPSLSIEIIFGKFETWKSLILSRRCIRIVCTAVHPSDGTSGTISQISQHKFIQAHATFRLVNWFFIHKLLSLLSSSLLWQPVWSQVNLPPMRPSFLLILSFKSMTRSFPTMFAFLITSTLSDS